MAHWFFNAHGAWYINKVKGQRPKVQGERLKVQKTRVKGKRIKVKGSAQAPVKSSTKIGGHIRCAPGFGLTNSRVGLWLITLPGHDGKRSRVVLVSYAGQVHLRYPSSQRAMPGKKLRWTGSSWFQEDPSTL